VIEARAFAEAWIAAWNAHDLDRILSHYAPDIVFVSPASTRFTGDPTGRVVGIDSLRDYWGRALAAIPDLRFTLRAALSGADGVAIRYHSSRTGGEVVEAVNFGPDGLVNQAQAYYE